VGKKPTEFGRAVKEQRLARGLTHEALARKAGLSARVISDIERSVIRSPHRPTQQRLADAFELDSAGREAFFNAVPPRRRPSKRTTAPAPPPLPVPATPLVNREQSVAAVSALLRRKDVRLVTLLGPVGVGKTRLSLAVATGLQRAYPGGIWFVDLAAVDDPARIAPVIAERLGIRLPASQAPLEALAEQLRERRMLLILDNLEQMEAGPVLIALLRMTTRLKVLATSRRSLHVRGEQEFIVHPLATPDPKDLPPQEDLARVESVALFVQCVQFDLPDFRLTPANAHAVAEICARLDGLPLAIELAASRVKVVSPEEMVPRLRSRLDLLTDGARDLPDRQRSLRAAIAWSRDLLPDDARVLFRRFAVFVGGATLAAVEVVCGDGQTDRRTDGKRDRTGNREQGTGIRSSSLSVCPSVRLSVSDVWGALGALLDASLLRREEGEDGEVRFTVLQTIREWALEELAASGEEAAVRARHAAWAVDLAEQAEPHLLAADQGSSLRRLRREQGNLGAALEWALARDGGTAIRLAGALADYWYARGQMVEGADCLRQALAAAPAEDPARVKALVGGSTLMLARGDFATATAWGEEALAIADRLGDRLGGAKALAVQGNVLQHRRAYDRAFDLHRQALDVFTDLGDDGWATNEFCNLAWTSHGMGDDATAAGFAEQLRRIAVATRDTYFAQVALLILGDLALAAGDAATATARYHEVFAGSWRRGDRWLAADAIVGFAAAVSAAGDPQRGARLLGAAEGLYRRLGVSFPPRDRPDYPAWRKSMEERLGEGGFGHAWSAGAALRPNEIADDAMAVVASMGCG
jgi:predicted ATPase/transcriptional regulator with XRE-family HTH domain